MPTLDTLPLTSRVWIYQSTREFSDSESSKIRGLVNDFVRNWDSHNVELSCSGDILHNRFIILMVDQNMQGASGCSIDKSVHFIQALGKAFQTDFFDRLNFAYLDGEQIKTAHKEEFQQLYQSGFIDDDTIVFNNLVDTREKMEKGWKVKLGESWFKTMVD